MLTDYDLRCFIRDLDEVKKLRPMTEREMQDMREESGATQEEDRLAGGGR